MGKQTTDIWEKISDQFYQKRNFSEDRASNITYYYRSKIGMPVTALEINSHISKQLCGFTLIKHDIKDCIDFLEEYLKIIKEENASQLIVKALIKSLVITYGKCFSDGNIRTTRLSPNIITPKNKKFHEEMIRLRNKYIAHADSSSDEYCKFVLLLPPEKFFKKKKGIQPEGYRELGQRVHANFFLNDCKPLLAEVDNYLNEKIAFLNDKMKREIEVLPPDTLYKIAKNATKKRCILENKDLDKMRKESHLLNTSK